MVQDLANNGTNEAAGGTLTLSSGEKGRVILADAGGTLSGTALRRARWP